MQPMPRAHDRGGWPGAGPINRAEHDPSMWEKRTDAMQELLSSLAALVTRDSMIGAARAREPEPIRS
jgi:hypothetical protein